MMVSARIQILRKKQIIFLEMFIKCTFCWIVVFIKAILRKLSFQGKRGNDLVRNELFGNLFGIAA